MLNKPAGVDFVAVFAVINWITFGFGGFSLSVGEIDVFEERAGTSFFEWIGKFVGADSTNYGADAFGREIGEVVIGNVFFDRTIERACHLAGFKMKGDRNDKVAILLGGVENTFAVGKAEVVVIQSFKSIAGRVEDLDGF